MKKTTLAVTLLLALIAFSAWAAGLGKNQKPSAYPVQMFTPDAGYSRLYSLNTKGFRKYSTVNKSGVAFVCTVTGTSTPATVKVFLNGDQSKYLPQSSGQYAISSSITATTSIGFSAYSSANSITCNVFGM